jgi:hypothetical protein
MGVSTGSSDDTHFSRNQTTDTADREDQETAVTTSSEAVLAAVIYEPGDQIVTPGTTYRVVRVLGHGGMGSALEVIDNGLNRNDVHETDDIERVALPALHGDCRRGEVLRLQESERAPQRVSKGEGEAVGPARWYRKLRVATRGSG